MVSLHSGLKIRIEGSGGQSALLTLPGRLDHETVARQWHGIHKQMRKVPAGILEIQAGALDYCDAAGICLLRSLHDTQVANGGQCRIAGLNAHLLHQFELAGAAPVAQGPANGAQCLCELVERTGELAMQLVADIRELIRFVGHMTVALGWIVMHPGRLRWKDTFWTIQTAGVNAFGIIALVSLLLGLILAFQSAIPLRRFGAQIFVADLVAISVARELGPLITAIILAGRTGSAFAAELGTMKVSEELNALQTMGLDPVRFLVAPRVLAALFVMPLLSIFSVAFALMGAAIVMHTLGFTMVAYLNQIKDAVSLADVLGGLFKAVNFGLLVAAIGCLRGLQTGAGARAVGVSATRAVVSGIFLILLADGLFAVLFYVLGI